MGAWDFWCNRVQLNVNLVRSRCTARECDLRGGSLGAPWINLVRLPPDAATFGAMCFPIRKARPGSRCHRHHVGFRREFPSGLRVLSQPIIEYGFDISCGDDG